MRAQRGFTLVELIVVIVIVGIMAAMAMPRLIAMQRDARISALNGMAGGLRSAVALAYGVYSAQPDTRINAEGTWVNVNHVAGNGVLLGAPDGTFDGIGGMMACTVIPSGSDYNCQGFIVTGMNAPDAKSKWFPSTNTGTNTLCYVEYDGKNGNVHVEIGANNGDGCQ